MSEPSKPRPVASRYGTLDGLRGVAALSVVALHEYQWLGNWTPYGGFLAVDLFFVLSGFVIAASYEERLASGAMSVLAFVKTRVIRFWPLFLLGLLAGLGTAVSSLISNHGQLVPVERDAWLSFLPGLFMLPLPPFSGLDAAFYPLDSVFWSLLFEMLVNLLYVLTRPLWTTPGLIAAMLVSGGVILVSGGQGFDGWNWRYGGMDVARVMFSFPAGVLIWRLRNLPLRLSPWVGAALLAICLACFVHRDPIVTELSVLAVFPVLVFLGSKCEPVGGLRLACLFLGEVSYAVYALHDPVISFLEALFTKLHVAPPGLPLAIGFAVLAVVGSWAADKYYDRPFGRWLKVRAGLRARRAAPLAA
jgi:peptidoglycan/LPS O-acetylase OafA/YrhL